MFVLSAASINDLCRILRCQTGLCWSFSSTVYGWITWPSQKHGPNKKNPNGHQSLVSSCVQAIYHSLITYRRQYDSSYALFVKGLNTLQIRPGSTVQCTRAPNTTNSCFCSKKQKVATADVTNWEKQISSIHLMHPSGFRCESPIFVLFTAIRPVIVLYPLVN